MTTSRGSEERRNVTHHPLTVSSWDWGVIICPLSIIVFALALLWRSLLAGEALFWGTPLLQFIPWQQLAADMWRSGHLPLWNPLTGCGAPLAANYQTAAFYPLNALFLVAPADVALSWTVALHVALTGWGMFRWGRAKGLDRFPALVGALALEGSGFLVGRVALFPSIAITYPWIPIWLWRAEVLLQRGRRPSRLLIRETRQILWLGLTIGLGLLAGHAQTAVYGGLLVAAYSIFRLIQDLRRGPQKRRSRTQEQSKTKQEAGSAQHRLLSAFLVLGLLLISVAMGLGLAMVQILPTAELLTHSQRSTGISSDFAMTYSFWPWRLITVVAPNFFGSPGDGTYWGYGAHWEDAVYLGLLPLLLAVGAVVQTSDTKQGGLRATGQGARTQARAVRRSLIKFWVVSAIIALILALGKNTPVFPLLFHNVPGFDLFQAPTRWLAITTLALAALAAIGAQHWPSGHRGRRKGALAVTFGGALLIGAVVAPRLVRSNILGADIPLTFGPATVRLGISLVLAGTMMLLRRRGHRAPRRQTTLWQAGVIAFVALDLLILGWSMVPTVDRSLYQGSTKTATTLRRERDQVRVYWPSDPAHQNQPYDAHYRVKFNYLTFDDFGPDDAIYWRGMREDLLPNTGMLDGIASANNFDPLLVSWYADALEAAIEVPRVLEAMGVTHVISDHPWRESKRLHTTASAALYRLSGTPGRAWVVPCARHTRSDQMLATMTDSSFDPTRTVLVEAALQQEEQVKGDEVLESSLFLQDGPNRVTIQADLNAPGFLVLADTWYPGWQVTVDDEPATLLRANHAFRAVQLEPGLHVVEMVYDPPLALLGQWVSLASLGVVAGGLLWTTWKGKDARET